MPTDDTDDTVNRFLNAASPAAREKIRQLPPGEQEKLAAAWEAELAEDTDLDTLSELSPAAAESEAAERVVQNLP
ncbi:hypothetical protein [Streptomyces triculaminicus]|uniref:Uncharacterized protein n=2 Tax=Streptomyces TaxID=1883 RepID=A0A939FKL1_9ACTN|nr:hypothetical protein [Streptomyces triculaminicus]MBO0652444.1 hypothetical protein [Streptomyces triculaminicus]